MNEDRNVELVIQLFSYGFSICVWFFCPSFSPRWKSKCVNVNIFIHRSSMIWSGDSAKANRRGRLRNKDKEHFDCSKYPIRSSINIDSYLTQAHHRHCHHIIAYHFFSFFFLHSAPLPCSTPAVHGYNIHTTTHIMCVCQRAYSCSYGLDAQFKDISALAIE